MSSRSYEGTDQVTWISLAAGVISQDLVPSELGVFDWLTHVQASPLTYLAVLGTCALDAILPIVPSEAVVIAASILATRGRVVDLGDRPSRRGWRVPRRHRLLSAWPHRVVARFVPGGRTVAIGACLAGSRSNKDGQRRPRRSVVVRYYAATLEYGLRSCPVICKELAAVSCPSLADPAGRPDPMGLAVAVVGWPVGGVCRR
jgi:hypothetical protein